MTGMIAPVQTLLAELKCRVAAIYGDRLRGVYLYGSYARSEQNWESDVDILIVLDTIADYGNEVERTGAMISTLSLEHGVSVSPVFVSEKNWLESDNPFLLNV